MPSNFLECRHENANKVRRDVNNSAAYVVKFGTCIISRNINTRRERDV